VELLAHELSTLICAWLSWWRIAMRNIPSCSISFLLFSVLTQWWVGSQRSIRFSGTAPRYSPRSRAIRRTRAIPPWPSPFLFFFSLHLCRQHRQHKRWMKRRYPLCDDVLPLFFFFLFFFSLLGRSCASKNRAGGILFGPPRATALRCSQWGTRSMCFLLFLLPPFPLSIG